MNSSEKIIAKNTKLITYFTGFLSFIVFVYVLIALKQILIPITIAVFLTFLFHPLLKYFAKYKIPKWVTLVFIFIALVTINYFLALVLISSVDNMQVMLQVYSENLSRTVQQILSPFNLTLKELAGMMGINVGDLEAESLFHRLFESGFLVNMFNSFTSILGDFFISMIFWVFMIMGKERFEERLKLAFLEKGDMISRSVTNIDEQLQSYIFLKTIISLATGIIFTIILLLFGIDFAIIWGLLAFVLNYIPNIGSLIATVIPILISFLEYGFGIHTISLSILLLVVQMVMGNFLEPHIMGRQMDLSPVFVLFSLVFWGLVWGIVGMFLAVPIAAAIKILCGNIEPLKPIALLMGTKITTESPATKA